MQLIFGLGNPGPRYAMTRHNVGFMVIERLAEREGIAIGRNRFSALTGEGSFQSQKVFLARPQTYMNLSGRSVAEAMRFYQESPEQLIVIHDELDVPFGRLKVKRGGGHAGHRGLQSIVSEIGSADFIRIRVGIGRPPERIPAADYVLQPFLDEERPALPALLDQALDAVGLILSVGLEAAMNRIHSVRE